jgi:hypothetical protein
MIHNILKTLSEGVQGRSNTLLRDSGYSNFENPKESVNDINYTILDSYIQINYGLINDIVLCMAPTQSR